MGLELNGKVVSERVDRATIESALQQMIAGDVLVLHRPPADFMQVEGTLAHGFTLNAYEDAQGTSFVSGSRRVASDKVVGIMARFADGASDWREALQDGKWQSGAKQQEKAQSVMDRPGIVGVIALVIFGIPFVAWAAFAGMIGEGSSIGWGDVWKGLVAIVVIAAYVSWVDVFFRVVRPHMSVWLGKRLNLQVDESQDVWDMGMWVAENGRPLSRVLVFFIDLAIIIPGVVVPLALPAAILLVIY